MYTFILKIADNVSLIFVPLFALVASSILSLCLLYIKKKMCISHLFLLLSHKAQAHTYTHKGQIYRRSRGSHTKHRYTYCIHRTGTHTRYTNTHAHSQREYITHQAHVPTNRRYTHTKQRYPHKTEVTLAQNMKHIYEGRLPKYPTKVQSHSVKHVLTKNMHTSNTHTHTHTHHYFKTLQAGHSSSDWMLLGIIMLWQRFIPWSTAFHSVLLCKLLDSGSIVHPVLDYDDINKQTTQWQQ